tara:strand:- start:2976 stop:3170 length:195 start_codon:yes stop_codon:yes gene_type:complete
MAATLSEVFLAKLREYMNNKADDLATGCASDYADYKYRVGFIEGIATAEAEFLDLIKRSAEEED